MEGGSVGGNGGCNAYFGSYELDGDALSFSGIGSTEMYCEGASDLESAYFANLDAATAGFSTGGSLIMTGADGEPILEFLPDESVAGPSDEAPIPTDGIEGLGWQLESLVDPITGEQLPVPADVVVTIVLEDGTVAGNGGCNGYSADYQLDGTSLSFGPVLSTKMACPEPAMGIENAFFAQLEHVASWHNDGGSVTLFVADGTELARLVPATEG
jgi:heat shock protein HslJ